MRDVATVLSQATTTYADVLAALADAGLPTVVTQTGGLCGALEVTLETGQHLLITAANDTTIMSTTTSMSGGLRWG